MKTQRIKPGKSMSKKEKEDYIKIIRKLPWLYSPILNALKIFGRKSSSLIDVGCGDGYLLSLIHKKFPSLELYGLDKDSFFIKNAKSKYNFNLKLEDMKEIKGKYD